MIVSLQVFRENQFLWNPRRRFLQWSTSHTKHLLREILENEQTRNPSCPVLYYGHIVTYHSFTSIVILCSILYACTAVLQCYNKKHTHCELRMRDVFVGARSAYTQAVLLWPTVGGSSSIACLWPLAAVASVWSNIPPTSCHSSSCCVSLVPKVCTNGSRWAVTHLHIGLFAA